MAVNLRSQMLMCKHAIPEMVAGGGGSIVNMSSGASLKGDRTRTAYGVSKAGVNTLTMYVAAGHGKQGVRVNTIVPGLIITDAVRAHLTEGMLAGARPSDAHAVPGPARRHRQSRRLPGLGRVALHHGTDDRHRRRHVRPRRRLRSGRAMTPVGDRDGDGDGRGSRRLRWDRGRRTRYRDGGTSRSRPGSRRRHGWSGR